MASKKTRPAPPAVPEEKTEETPPVAVAPAPVLSAQEAPPEEIPMPGSNNPPCPLCGQPMTQARKSGNNHIRYYYCRSFGPAPSCRSPGLYLTSKQYHQLHFRLENGIDVWSYRPDERLYRFERDVLDAKDFLK